ncbi:bifunctional 4-hydroxy-2-oxoglutarate aldolase/2-dehydro-3-deoxy-phosphogluconate aldolase [Thermoanaerobacterium sp. DL9XJH110]|uniref:bifunctional 4-hydroxy-2-oxoglutarate aldolase/2-dehydro-3-deoxy-phosphogluconate aldolase n=1 Tax=Thermoanaerobacterium sp. DL9XJH110 TaxID=3386643 RepID=UPI003BB773D7
MKQFTKEEVRQFILDEKLIAIIRRIPQKHLFKTIETILEAGIKVAEITLNTDDSINLIKLLHKNFCDCMLIGGGTVTSAKAAGQAIEAGARFIVTPIMLPEVIEVCNDLDITVIPGAFSPTEIFQAYYLGADIIKVFPANTLGASYFKDLQGPMPEIPLAAVGGITLENGRAFLQAGANVLGVGSSLISRELIYAENWLELKELARKFNELVHQIN